MKILIKILIRLLTGTKYAILIKPTMRCNLNCDYCIVNKTTGRRPKYNERTFGDWIRLLIKRKPRMVTISGGEPLLYPFIEHIVNLLTWRMIIVTMQTNLMIFNENLTPSNFLFIFATYHKGCNKTLFEKNLKKYREKGFNVSVAEFGNEIEGSRKKELKSKQADEKVEIYAPDLRKFNSWVELELNG